MRETAKITMVQLTEHADPKSVIDRMPAFFETAAAFGSDVIAFPEYCLGRHITLDAPSVQCFRDLARQHRMYAIGGLIETVGDRWSTTALLVDRQGQIIDRYLKVHPAAGIQPYSWPPIPGEDAEARGILGDEFKTYDLDFGRVGILQCYDGYFPEAWALTSYAGAEIVFWINGRCSMVQDAICISAAGMHACVVAANVSDGYNTGFAEPMYGQYVFAEGNREESRLFPRLPERGDGAVHAQIDLAAVRRLRKHHRVQHQRRPELYGKLTQPVEMWKQYPDIPWVHEACADLVNKAHLP